MCDYHAFSRDFTQLHKTRGVRSLGKIINLRTMSQGAALGALLGCGG
jgi:hypothetical protein